MSNTLNFSSQYENLISCSA
uniref:Uncharacterized protein n=1 Tax=Anguilla anguilla TaxID=7936 RepID=A0A0E9S8W9_ANGAN